jgi:aminopeptidase N
VLGDAGLDDLMRGELLILPSETYLSEQLLVNHPAQVHATREALKRWIWRRAGRGVPRAARSLRRGALQPLARGARRAQAQDPGARLSRRGRSRGRRAARAKAQFDAATT